jgi:hypothetical protein
MINLKETLDWAKHYRQQRRRWREARSVEELGQRGAEWMRGELGAHPGGYDVPAAETEPLRPVLARANAAGFFTDQSQPGGRWVEHVGLVEQRAFVSGFLARDDLLEFRRHLEGAGMLVLDSMTHDEPLSKEDGVVVTSGRWKVCRDFSHISSAASRDLDQAACLDVIDVVWCRENALWDALDGWAASRGA